MSSAETLDQIHSRHKKEARDLINKTTSMKKQATKSTKKDIQKQIIELEQELKQRHEQELKDFDSSNAVSNTDEKNEADQNKESENEDEDEFSPEKLLAQLELDAQQSQPKQPEPQQQQQQQQQRKGPKRNKQKERLAKRAAKIEEEKAKAREEALLQPDLKKIEQTHIDELCQMAKVKQFDIAPDGNCLFASIRDQLKYRQDVDVSIKELRAKAAEHILADPETFTPYLFDEETMSMKDIKQYCDEIANTSAWGSDLEILALARIYNSPISVMMSGRSTLKIWEQGEGDELKLCYYKHSYALGEHYNSLRDLEDE
ncbi:hypothetical protein WICPIJ_009875 [Wickerhamomyces pijperi]|uniref:OTU domain-containing protein n=1 Tax=Wickerhamomyces pijperi TaxID=599730 RepID=A0A9P8PJI5_WICPI|nr:hypothetical protein WICPIJ_009875 [Wickerhamomyces pijperi]